jgi:hypothetical protein
MRLFSDGVARRTRARLTQKYSTWVLLSIYCQLENHKGKDFWALLLEGLELICPRTFIRAAEE